MSFTILGNQVSDVLPGAQITLTSLFETYPGSGLGATASDVTIGITAAPGPSGGSGTPLAPSFSDAPTGTNCTADGKAPAHVCGALSRPSYASMSRPSRKSITDHQWPPETSDHGITPTTSDHPMASPSPASVLLTRARACQEFAQKQSSQATN